MLVLLSFLAPLQHSFSPATKPTRIAKHHAPPVRYHRAHLRSLPPPDAYDLCVGNRENGEPGATTYNTIHWHVVNDYDGAYSFLPETWDAAGGQRYAARANEATPRQQTRIFEHWSSIDPGAWPNTIPPCLYLR